MEDERTPTLRLGAFAALGIGVLLVGMALIGNKRHLFTQTFTLHAMFHDVGGLQVGNHVRYAGVNIGSVKEMSFQDARTIRVSLTVDEKVQRFLTTSSVGTVSSEGLIGNKILVITEPGTGGAPLKDQDQIQAFPPPNLDDLFAQVKKSVSNFNQITQDLGVISHQASEGKGMVGKMLMDRRFARTVDQTLINLQEGSKGFKENMDAAKHSWVLWGFGKAKDKAAPAEVPEK